MVAVAEFRALSCALCLHAKHTSFNMRRIFCVILGLCTMSLAISSHVPVQYVPLGNKVRIPCDGYGDHRTGKWLHKKGENKFETIFHENSGFTFQNKPLSTRKKIFRNFSLEITHFTELDKGTYVCQLCTSIMRCTNGKPITLLPLFDTFSTALRTLFIMEGDQFSYSCLYNLTLKADWRFEALGENTAISLNHELNNKNVLFIPDVQPTNAGKYSYWGETSTGQQQRLCSVTLCVLTDMDADGGASAVVETDKWNISITGRVNKPKSSLNCRLLSSDVETHTFSLEDAAATAQLHVISSITADHLYSSRPPVAALICMSTALLFIILIAPFILLRVLRQMADRNSRSANGHSEEGNESQVIYSTLQVGRYQQQNVFTSDIECVYSQIKV
ncbi:uncharacterized protein LOC108257214 isoform X2 [Ictalurus punctatus]|uniref:Uncharacterized protein LOC108257214 isoform X2 n=1 Tax=Ictalurus punctatus TaxID=7998 RepID=A0A9F7R454_ICTPU|nr:uncharacterized protein LOC108257214 isoform X2 [Ictalurus punctatus]